MDKKHVLIVDDAKDLLFLLTHSVKRLGPDYEVSTATDAVTALKLLKKQKFDLVLTDYMMGSMTGLDLAEEVRKISPETQVILMSAYDTTTLRDSVKELELTGYLGKPFTIPKVLEIVEQTIARTNKAPQPAPTEELTDKAKIIDDTLKTVYLKTGAHYVLLLNSQGRPIQVVGRVESATLSRLAAFIAANFLAVTELASLLGDNSSVFKSSYHEGNNYNIYSHDIDGEHLLAVVFGTKDKPGTVWFYTKKAVETLTTILNNPVQEYENGELETKIIEDFQNLLGRETGPSH